MKPRKQVLPRNPGAERKATHEEIVRVAYAIYEREGKPEGKDLEHWFNAESMCESQFGYGRDHAEHDFTKSIEEA